MFDNYRATHNQTWLAAAQGAWDIVSKNFIHIDGTSALTEGASENSLTGNTHLLTRTCRSVRTVPSSHTAYL